MKKPRLVWCVLVLLSAAADTGNGFGGEGLKSGTGELKAEEPRELTGCIYAPDTHQLLFKFKRVANRSGSTLNVQRDFTYPDGKLAAREQVIYQGNTLASYELNEVQIGASGTATILRATNSPTQGSIEFTYIQQAGKRPRVRVETLREPALMADMVGPFLASNWDALQRGERVKCRFIVVPRTETVGFTFIKELETEEGAGNVLVLRMEPSSPFVSALVDPLFFTMDQAPPHRVLKYLGRTTPKIRVAGKWRDLDAVTVFDWGTTQ